MWWLRRSIRTNSASLYRSECAAASPAKPPPTITIRLRSRRGASTTAVASSGRGSANMALLAHLVRAVWRSWPSNSLSALALSTHQPFGFARASRHKHGSERAGGPRQDHLVRHSLIGSKRRFRRKQIWCDVCVLVGRSGSLSRIILIENTERKQPQHGAG